ncbi:MAG: (Fe-S)-binding protein [Clostridium sp.]|nr:(Fe-S)-binding protein [Clostridium sp.]
MEVKMKDLIRNKVKKYLLENKENWNSETNDRIYDEPIIKFASAEDPLFKEYKSIIGKKHFTPKEVYEKEFGENSYQGGTVISVVLPINEKIRKANRAQKEWASKELIASSSFDFENDVSQYLTDILTEMGYKTVAPSNTKWFKKIIKLKGPISNWSERHAAYVAGLGTFSLNEGFITEKGMAIRLVSVVTELKLEPDVREAKNHMGNCLYYNNGTCGACIKRCPVNALSKKGHNKWKCYHHVYVATEKKFGASQCSLCQTSVPCEYRNPTLAFAKQ